MDILKNCDDTPKKDKNSGLGAIRTPNPCRVKPPSELVSKIITATAVIGCNARTRIISLDASNTTVQK